MSQIIQKTSNTQDAPLQHGTLSVSKPRRISVQKRTITVMARKLFKCFFNQNL